jgi:2-haloacid dehalogenase
MSEAIRALVFDVFGTLVDWRSGVARHAEAVLAPLGYRWDWLAFADAWRGEYEPALERVRRGSVPFEKLDAIHRQMLARVLPRFLAADPPDSARPSPSPPEEATLNALNLAWHRLDAWPDARPGLDRLRRKFLLAPVSNGNISIMLALARRNGFIWDAVLGAELALDYKPKPRVYEQAVQALDLPPAACMMVAAHAYDLDGAAACGLRTAHVARPEEHGPRKPASEGDLGRFDLRANSLEDLASQLGARATRRG